MRNLTIIKTGQQVKTMGHTKDLLNQQEEGSVQEADILHEQYLKEQAYLQAEQELEQELERPKEES